jgi:hypothetical protein
MPDTSLLWLDSIPPKRADCPPSVGNSVRHAAGITIRHGPERAFCPRVLWAVAEKQVDHHAALICAALLALSPNFVVDTT